MSYDDDALGNPDDAIGDPIVRGFGQVDPTQQYSDVLDLAGGAECVFYGGPLFKIVMVALWPDIDDAEITRLFGPDSLDWWNALSDDEKEDRIATRGVNWLDNPTPAEVDQEREQRAVDFTESVDCNFMVKSGVDGHPRDLATSG